ncbi:hypothetical protein OHC33_001674 [Knufia fluminis]|uniref:DAGKc domain-containing protein n=1 Tax=Knufia fluminis TaxID=191047 RepID=A0AAN8I6U5_9EURO|nr:hypothetical protein OHC33_001674 [Knufia fluminis]
MAAEERPKPSRLPSHFLPDREVHVIISTHSGNHEAQSYYSDTLHGYLTDHVPHLELRKNYFVHTTTSLTSITELTSKLFLFNAKKGVKNTIILLSGDGGMVDIVNAMTTTLQREVDDNRPPSIFFKPIIVLFPLGTANALCHSAGIIARDPLKVMMTGRAKPLPQFEVRFSRAARLVADEGRKRLEFNEPGFPEEGKEASGELGYYDPEGHVRVYGCVVFSWGLHASLVAFSDTEEMRKHGVERFRMAAGQLLEEGHVYSGTVKYKTERGGEWLVLQHKSGSGSDADGDKKHKYILATLVSNLEEKFCISPHSKPLDGTLRLVAIGNQPSDTAVKILTLAYEQGKHVEEMREFVTYHEIDSLRIDFNENDEKWRQICIDGKIVAIEEGGWVEVRKMPTTGVDGRRVVELVC